MRHGQDLYRDAASYVLHASCGLIICSVRPYACTCTCAAVWFSSRRGVNSNSNFQPKVHTCTCASTHLSRSAHAGARQRARAPDRDRHGDSATYACTDICMYMYMYIHACAGRVAIDICMHAPRRRPAGSHATCTGTGTAVPATRTCRTAGAGMYMCSTPCQARAGVGCLYAADRYPGYISIRMSRRRPRTRPRGLLDGARMYACTYGHRQLSRVAWTHIAFPL